MNNLFRTTQPHISFRREKRSVVKWSTDINCSAYNMRTMSEVIFLVIAIWLSSACIHTNFQKHSFPFTFINNEEERNAFTTELPTSLNYLKTGTTIVGICCRDGVVLGADTRCTGGPLIVDKNKLKIHPIASRIFCCAAGTSAQCDQVTRQAAQYLVTS